MLCVCMPLQARIAETEQAEAEVAQAKAELDAVRKRQMQAASGAVVRRD